MIGRRLARVVRGLVPAVVLAGLLVAPLPAPAAGADTGTTGAASENATSDPGWEVMAPPAGLSDGFIGVWGNSSDDVFAVSGCGSVVHYDGTGWSQLEPVPLVSDSGEMDLGAGMDGIWGASSADLFAVGDLSWHQACVFHYDGSSWTAQTGAGGDTTEICGIWGSSSSDVFAVGFAGDAGFAHHYDGVSWTSFCGANGGNLIFETRAHDVWGTSPSDVFVVGNSTRGSEGAIYHYDGGQWSTIWESSAAALSLDYMGLHGVWGTSSSDIYAYGGGYDAFADERRQLVLHYDGSAFTFVDTGATARLVGMWGGSATDVYAAQDDGTILHYDGISWSAVSLGSASLCDAWGTGSEAFGVGGAIVHHAGVVPPGVATGCASDVTVSSSELRGHLSSLGTASSVQVSFEWGPTTDYGQSTTPENRTAAGEFSAHLGGLSPWTAYHVRAKVVGDTTAYGCDRTFVTPGVPGVVTSLASSLGGDEAVLNGVLVSPRESRIVAVESGGHHSLGLGSDGTLWAWGLNYYGQMGLGDSTDRTVPTQVGSTGDWVSVAGGYMYSLGLRSGGTLWAWGRNASGQLGLGDNADRYSPVRVGSDSDWVAVSAGEEHTLGLKSDGTLWAWGSNQYGQLGLGTTAATNRPVRVGSDANWVSVSAGGCHSLGLRSDGTLWAWGWNYFRQVDPRDWQDRGVPVQLGDDSNWKAVSAGGYHSVALRSDGTLWAWGGWSFWGATVEQVGSDASWVAVSAGHAHCLGLQSDGSLWSWDCNDSGQLGQGDTARRQAPVRVGTAGDWVAVGAGYEHSIGLRFDGTICGWGANYFGQLGVGGRGQRLSPATRAPNSIVPCTVYFEYGLTTEYGAATESQAMTSTGCFSAVIGGLDPDTPYHYRAVTAGDGTVYGEDRVFTTVAGVPSPSAPGGPAGSGGGPTPPGAPIVEAPSEVAVRAESELVGDGGTERTAADMFPDTAVTPEDCAVDEIPAQTRLWVSPMAVIGGFLGLAAMGSFAAWLRGRIK